MTGEDLQLIFEKAVSRLGSLFGFEVKRLVRARRQPIDILGMAIRELMADQPDIFFVQIGANDGLTHDPIAPYVRKYLWRGLLIEPQPAVFAKLRENYAAFPQLIFENVAIDSEEGSLTLFCFQGAAADSHSSMLTSAKKHYLQLNGDGEKGRVVSIQVPSKTLASLLAKHKIERVDLLQIDTEGHDFTILKSIDFSQIRPKIIHFENNFLTTRQRQECLQMFEQHGYASLDLGIDTIAYHQRQDETFKERIATSKVVG